MSDRTVPDRLRPAVLRLLVVLVGTASAFITAEYGARFVFRDVKSSGNGGDYFARRGGGPEISTNSLGYREREIGPKNSKRYRIVVIGDSFTWGQGIDVRDRFTNLLEESLNPTTHEVLNFGIPGHNMPEHLQELEQVLPLSPDFILLQLYINDFETPEMVRPQGHPLISSEDLDRRLMQSSALYVLLSNQWGELESKFGFVESYEHYMARNLADPSMPNARKAFGMLRQFIERARSGNTPCGTVLFPAPDAMGPKGAGYPFGYIHERVRMICQDARIPCLDLLPAFSTYANPRSMWVSPFDAHPNGMANRRAASEILRMFGPSWHGG